MAGGPPFTPVDNSGAVIGGSGTPISLTDRSGTITAGGTAQQAAAANASRTFLMITNPSATATLYFSTTGTAAVETAGSTAVGPGGGYVFDVRVPVGAVSVIGATTGQPFTVKEA